MTTITKPSRAEAAGIKGSAHAYDAGLVAQCEGANTGRVKIPQEMVFIRMGRAMLEQALSDLQKVVDGGPDVSVRANAERFLLGDLGDLEYWCELAEIPVHRMRAAARRFIAERDEREALGTYGRGPGRRVPESFTRKARNESKPRVAVA